MRTGPAELRQSENNIRDIRTRGIVSLFYIISFYLRPSPTDGPQHNVYTMPFNGN